MFLKTDYLSAEKHVFKEQLLDTYERLKIERKNESTTVL
jgi:hypothetical protein